jgi:formate-dependent nitrite reductase membrane component NrfD
MTTTYYDVPLLKPPVWTWEIPAYFFVGGAAGGAAVIGAVAQFTGTNGTLARDARWLAAAGGPVSAALLITDLGRPERFFNMLRVFKPQSAMSVGSWTLAAFSASRPPALGPNTVL